MQPTANHKRARWPWRLATAALFSLFVWSHAAFVFAQTIVATPGAESAYILRGDQVLTSMHTKLDTLVHVIVEFTEPPLTHAGPGPGKTAEFASKRQAIKAQHDQFDRFVNTSGPGNALSNQSPILIRHRFHRVINGVALLVSRAQSGEIRALSFVSRVREEKMFSVLDAGSNLAVHADRVFEEHGLTGSGVTIAILDTGIDYLHPDLGGGIGPGYRVRAGYDFVNEDPDPMDDAGHGTHVAGISSGASADVPGIAPGSLLLAVKVLDANGVGLESDIIAGIEFAMDPDGDPMTDDGADIINMSLGGPGGPDDALSRAVDRAVRAGILCVVAAGNNGAYQSITSPGSAGEALTVGATDKEDRIASFSSRGPSTNSLAVKPELVAPGVGVNSTRLGGGYQIRSGTSMATPLVAGAAALLLEMHTDWDPDQLKSALITTSDPIDADIWTQGSGRMNVEKALSAQFSAITPVLDFGDVETDQPVWTSHRQTRIVSHSSAGQHVTIRVISGLPEGMQVLVTPQEALLDPGSELDVNVQITIDNLVLGYDALPPETSFTLEIASDATRLRIPVSTIKSHRLDIEFDRDPFLVFLLSEQNSTILSAGAAARVIVAPGVYSVLTLFQTYEADSGLNRRSFHLRQNVQIEGRTRLEIADTDATDNVRILARNEFGEELIEPFDAELVLIEPGGFRLLLLGDPAYSIASFAGLNSEITVDHVFIERNETARDQPDRVIPLRIKPGATSTGNDPSSFQTLRYDFAVSAATESVTIVHMLPFGRGRSIAVAPGEPFGARIRFPFTRDVMLSPFPSVDFSFSGIRLDLYDATGDVIPDIDRGSNLIYTGGTISEHNDSLQIVYASSFVDLGPTRTEPWLVSQGKSLPFWRANMLQFVSDRIYMAQPPFFLSSHLEARNEKSRFELLTVDEEGMGQSGYILNSATGGLPGNIVFAPGERELLWEFSGYSIDGLPGVTTVSIRFDSRVQTRQPGNLSYMAVLSGGVPGAVVDDSSQGEILVRSAFGEDRIELFMARLGSRKWQQLSAPGIAHNPILAVIPAGLERGFYSLKVRLISPEGSVMEQIIEPAFRQGRKDLATNSPPGSFQLEAPLNGARLKKNPGQPIQFSWFPSEDADTEDVVWYSVHIEGPSMDTTAVVLTGTSFTLDNTAAILPEAVYTWSVRSSDGIVSIPADAPFSFVLAASSTTTESRSTIPDRPRFVSAYPNPFSAQILFVFEQVDAGPVSLEVFDLLGRRVAVLQEEDAQPGLGSLSWKPDGVPSGSYFVRLTVGKDTFYRNLILIH